MAHCLNFRHRELVTVAVMTLALSGGARAGEITIDFVGQSPISSGFSYNLSFTLTTTDYIDAASILAAPTNADPNATQTYGAYTIEGISGTLVKTQVSNNTPYATGTIGTLQLAGLAIGANNATDNLLYPLLANPNGSLITDANGNPESATGQVGTATTAYNFDDQGFAFAIGSQVVQLTADLANTGLYVLTTSTGTTLLKKGSTVFTVADPSVVTEISAPATLALLGAGLAGIGLIRRRKADAVSAATLSAGRTG